MVTDLLTQFAIEAGKKSGKKVISSIIAGTSAAVLGIFAINRIITRKDRQEEKEHLEQKQRLEERERIKNAGIAELDHIIHRYRLTNNVCAFTAEYGRYYKDILFRFSTVDGINFTLYSSSNDNPTFVVMDSCFTTLMAIARLIPFVQRNNMEYYNPQISNEKRIITEDGFLKREKKTRSSYIGPVPSIDDYLHPEDVKSLTDDEKNILRMVIDKWLSGEVLTLVDISETEYSQWTERLSAIDEVLKSIANPE